MKPKTLINLFAILTLALALGGALNADPVHAQNPELPGGSVAQGAVLGTGFTYQGQLTDTSGNPIAGPCDFQFSLWDAASGGAQVGSTQSKTNVSLDNGYFSAALDFGATAFQGDARWMAISVACPTGGSYTPLTGRVALTAAPYALSLRPGASIQSAGVALNLSTSATTGFALNVVATGASAIYGQGGSSTGAGVTGFNTSAASTASGVTGLNGGNGSGVFGQTVSGRGVYGKATDLANGYGVYSEGNAYVDGNLSWKSKTSYISVPAAAFQPAVDGYDYSNNGSDLWNVDSNSDFYLAAVQLPHGATVTKLTFYWWDGSASDGYCALYRINLMGSENTMASASTYGSAASPLASVDASIDLATVDNSSYAYYLWLNLPDNLVAGYGAVIEYTITGPY